MKPWEIGYVMGVLEGLALKYRIQEEPAIGKALEILKNAVDPVIMCKRHGTFRLSEGCSLCSDEEIGPPYTALVCDPKSNTHIDSGVMEFSNGDRKCVACGKFVTP